MAIVTDPDNLDRYQVVFGTESEEISIFDVGTQVASGIDAQTSTANSDVFRDDDGGFIAASVSANDILVIHNGPNAGHYRVSAVTNASTLAIKTSAQFTGFVDASSLVYSINDPYGGSAADGVTKQALYSFAKEEWRVDAFSSTVGTGDDLIRHQFPFEPITSESMEIGGGDTHTDWVYKNDYTRKKIRTGGWASKNTAASTIAEYAGVITLGTINADAQVYYQQVSAQNAPTDFTFLGGVNEAILTYSSGAGAATPTDYRSYLKLFLRQKYYTYAQSQISDIGVTQLDTIVNRFPLTHAADTAITASDGQILGSSPFRIITSSLVDTGIDTTLGETSVTDASAGTDFLAAGVVVGDTLQIKAGADAGYYTIASVGTQSLDIATDADFTGWASTDTDNAYAITTTFIVASTGAGIAGFIEDMQISAGVSAAVAIASSDSATFVTDGVAAGDYLEIGSATSDHEGMYQIVSVVSEKRLWVDSTDNPFTSVAGVDFRVREPGMYFQYKKEDVSLSALASVHFASATGKITRDSGSWTGDGVTAGTIVVIASASATANELSFTVASAGTTDIQLVSSDWARLTDAVDAVVSATAYDAFKRTINGRVYGFNWRLFGNNGTAAQCYQFHQHQMRQSGDIDWGADAFRGDVNNLLLSYATPTGTTSNLHIDDINADDTNNVTYVDATGQSRTYPYVASMTINFNVNLQNDSNAVYRMYHTSVPAGDYGTKDAVLVTDGDGNPISGAVGGSPSVSKTFDYDGNTDGGRTPGDANVTLVAIGLNYAQFVITTGTITRSKGLSFSLTAALERNYANP